MEKKPEYLSSEVSIPLVDKGISLKGTLIVPEAADILVIFAHGSGSGRFSPRNKHVADVLVENGLAILLMDLLTEQEEAIDLETAQYRFDVQQLSKRLVAASEWASKNEKTHLLKLSFFGASTGAAAALIAAAELGSKVKAVVSRGGRPDMAANALSKVLAPTLLIVGGSDFAVMELNERAFKLLKIEKKFVVIRGATHLFEEPGKLDEVAELAVSWFKQHS